MGDSRLTGRTTRLSEPCLYISTSITLETISMKKSHHVHIVGEFIGSMEVKDQNYIQPHISAPIRHILSSDLVTAAVRRRTGGVMLSSGNVKSETNHVKDAGCGKTKRSFNSSGFAEQNSDTPRDVAHLPQNSTSMYSA